MAPIWKRLLEAEHTGGEAGDDGDEGGKLGAEHVGEAVSDGERSMSEPESDWKKLVVGRSDAQTFLELQ